jgi:AcrR family transcriptional regulator
MLYYYFGNKEALFLAVLESRYAHIRRAELGLHLGALDPEDGIRRLIAFTWDYYLKHPEFLTLLNSENLHRARHLRRSRQIAAMHSPLVAMLGDLLERGVRAGEFRRGVDPVQLYISIAGLGYFYLEQPAHAVDDFRARPAGRALQVRTAQAHDRARPGLPVEVNKGDAMNLLKTAVAAAPSPPLFPRRRNGSHPSPINIIVPWAAGGATDQVTRVAAGELEEALGAKIVVINQPGASGSIGTMNAMNAPRDGYTWTAGAPKQLGTYPVLGWPAQSSATSIFRLGDAGADRRV